MGSLHAERTKQSCLPHILGLNGVFVKSKIIVFRLLIAINISITMVN